MSKIDAVEIGPPDIRRNERFHLFPYERLESFAITAGLIGGFTGFYEGTKLASIRYLTENGHRLPRTVGGWYFYHKKKNYVMIVNGVQTGLRHGFKYTFMVGGFFGLEYLIDKYIRHDTIDLFNTMTASTIFAGIYGIYNNLSAVQVKKYMFKGSAMGLSLGITQDLLIFTRGGNVWYLDKLGIKNPKHNDKSIVSL
ncbi:uncharacterized protein RJT21DRAFT_121491 [Scheffersomyces amazonensis]|uniref:uncharacterized protein n=1 Tax=Scheffersomyces amazonensis TaxID=1078765 RepID=UPI00315DA733